MLLAAARACNRANTALSLGSILLFPVSPAVMTANSRPVIFLRSPLADVTRQQVLLAVSKRVSPVLPRIARSRLLENMCHRRGQPYTRLLTRVRLSLALELDVPLLSGGSSAFGELRSFRKVVILNLSFFRAGNSFFYLSHFVSVKEKNISCFFFL